MIRHRRKRAMRSTRSSSSFIASCVDSRLSEPATASRFCCGGGTMKKNRMKAKLRAGEPVFGVSVMIPSPQIVEMVAAAGFDWVLLDCEHGTLTLESVELMAMAAEACGITAIARPVTRSPEHILQVLDRGVMGVQVPHVNTAADARQVIAAVKYHPLGQRGLAAGTRAAVYDSHGTLADYVKAANEETLVAIQLEDEP